jgi:steroid delta-isomerase-like uncharacterized protein
MSTDAAVAPRAVAMEIFDALGRHDIDAMLSRVHPDLVDDFVAVGVFRGVAQVRGFFDELLGAFPDFAIEVIGTVSDDERAVVQWRATGTFTGSPFQGVRATGRGVELRGCDVMQVIQGRVKHNTIYYDGLGFARRIGMLPAERSFADRAMTAAFNARTDLVARFRRN